MAKVEMYSSNGCPFCDRAKDLLTAKGVEFTVYNLSEEPARMAEMQERKPGARTVPQIFINDQSIGGYDDMKALDDDGKLDPLLSANDGGSAPKSNPPKI